MEIYVTKDCFSESVTIKVVVGDGPKVYGVCPSPITTYICVLDYGLTMSDNMNS